MRKSKGTFQKAGKVCLKAPGGEKRVGDHVCRGCSSYRLGVKISGSGTAYGASDSNKTSTA